jgi:hypothetical protein
MRSKEFEQIAALLLLLGKEELEQVRARAGVLAQAAGINGRTSPAAELSAPQISADESDIDLVLSEIAALLRDQGVEFASVPMLKRVTNFKSFAEKVPATMKFFRGVTTNRTKLRALIRISISLLYKDLIKMNMAATTRTLMSHWHRVPAVMDKNFPGYARAGHLGLLFQDSVLPKS